jgi:hypothetical protein
MHQDIQNFSDILDIEPADQLQVRLIIEPHGNIHYRLRLNGHLISELDTTYSLGLFSMIKLHCEVFDPGQGAVEIKLLSINRQEVLPRYQHLAQPPTAWIDQPGSWDFHIPGPFYPWFHGISGQGWVA